MAVGDTTGISGLLQNPDVIKLMNNILPNVLGDKGMTDSGSGLGVIGGALAGFIAGKVINNNDTAAAVGAHALTTADVQSIVTGAQNSQTLGSVQGEIWKAEGNVQTAISASQNASQLATLNAEIASLQGQAVITKAITEGVITTQAGDANIINAINGTAYNTAAAIATSTAANLATTNALASQAAANAAQANAAILENKFALSQVTVADGEKTRAAIALLSASIPNARELDLQRQLTVALDDHRHTSTRGAIESGNVSVITNVAQSQAQQQQQAQFATLTGVVGQLVAAQHATNTAVTIGNGNRPTQTASNVNA